MGRSAAVRMMKALARPTLRSAWARLPRGTCFTGPNSEEVRPESAS
jgi:hypothetical protein